MDDLERFLTAQRAFTDRVHAVAENQWHLDTPDTEWTVADLLGHLIEEHRYAAPLLHGQDLETAGQIVEGSRSLPVDGGVGANLAEEWDEAAVESADAFSSDGALDRTVELSRGTTSVRDYVKEMTFDLVVHGWDLATAIGYSGPPFPDEVVEDIYAAAKEFGDLSSSGFFAPPVDVPDDAPTLDKLIGLTGRRPR
jgi:uncharacterized protein (TIGR03086 family)